VVVAARHLYAYDPTAKQWSALADLRPQMQPEALAYHPGEDALFTLGQDWSDERGGIVLCRYDDRGTQVGKIQLGGEVLSTVNLGSILDPTQLVAAGDFLVVFGASPDFTAPPRQPGLEIFLFLVEPKTGTVRLTWREPQG
jgi:hypothetical protein